MARIGRDVTDDLIPWLRAPRGMATMTEQECTCDLIDVSAGAEIQFVRGLSRGCKVHPEGEYERQLREAQETRDVEVEAAMQRAREAP